MAENTFPILIDETDNAEIRNAIKKGVLIYNAPYLGPPASTPFSLYIKDKDSNIIAGLQGFLSAELLKVDWAWVAPDYRLRGLGTKLFRKLDEYALSKNCQLIQLDTLSFQARPFYEKLGYKCLGTISKLYGESDCHFMRKVL